MPIFLYIQSFQKQILQKKLKAYAGFKLGLSETKASTLTT